MNSRIYLWVDDIGNGCEANIEQLGSEWTFTRFMPTRDEAIRAVVASYRHHMKRQRTARTEIRMQYQDPIAELANETDAVRGLRFRRSLNEVVARNFRVDNDNTAPATCGAADVDADGRCVA